MGEEQGTPSVKDVAGRKKRRVGCGTEKTGLGPTKKEGLGAETKRRTKQENEKARKSNSFVQKTGGKVGVTEQRVGGLVYTLNGVRGGGSTAVKRPPGTQSRPGKWINFSQGRKR